MKVTKLTFLGMILFFLFTGADCKKKKNCHSEIQFTNRSNSVIICGEKWTDAINGKCNLSGPKLNTGESHELVNGQFSCWEGNLSDGKTHDIYIIDPADYNDPTIFYSCDSIEIKNKVLKHYTLTLEELKKTNFNITYP